MKTVLFMLFGLCSPSLLSATKTGLMFPVEFKATSNGKVDVYITNNYPYRITGLVSLSKTEVDEGNPYESIVVLQPRERRKVITGKPKKNKLETNWSYIEGDITSYHAGYIYRIPFQEGLETVIVQSFGDKVQKTHVDPKDPNSKFAIDFSAIEGTPVVASREGYVLEAKYDSTISCLNISCADKANFVRIIHADGTIGSYAHFKRSEPIVKKGQYIQTGNLIGYVGSTGFSAGPHLHFDVARPTYKNNVFYRQRLPLLLTDGRQIFPPKTGNVIKFSPN